MQCRGTSYLRRLRILDFELTDERAVRKSISGGGLCENECKQCLVKTISTPQCSQRIFRAQSLVPCKYQKDSVFVHGYSQEYFGVWILVGAGHRRSGRSKQRCSRRYPFGLATRELRVQPLGLRHHTPFIMQPAAGTLLSDLQIPLANTIQFVAALRFNFFFHPTWIVWAAASRPVDLFTTLLHSPSFDSGTATGEHANARRRGRPPFAASAKRWIMWMLPSPL